MEDATASETKLTTAITKSPIANPTPSTTKAESTQEGDADVQDEAVSGMVAGFREQAQPQEQKKTDMGKADDQMSGSIKTSISSVVKQRMVESPSSSTRMVRVVKISS